MATHRHQTARESVCPLAVPPTPTLHHSLSHSLRLSNSLSLPLSLSPLSPPLSSSLSPSLSLPVLANAFCLLSACLWEFLMALLAFGFGFWHTLFGHCLLLLLFAFFRFFFYAFFTSFADTTSSSNSGSSSGSTNCRRQRFTLIDIDSWPSATKCHSPLSSPRPPLSLPCLSNYLGSADIIVQLIHTWSEVSPCFVLCILCNW